MVTSANRQLRLARRPVGLPDETTWRVTVQAAGPVGDGEARIEVQYLSVDPAMRLWLNEGPGYTTPVQPGDVMRASGVGRVVESRSPLEVGALVRGRVGVQEQAVLPASELVAVDTAVARPETHLGALGSSGLTAYIGLLDVGRPQPGETVVVSGAAGAVGSVAGQIARIHGCRVIGIAGGPEKCAWVRDELGFDACLDYKAHDVAEALGDVASSGVDVYFDNVGGDVLDAVLVHLADRARVVMCGAISEYNAEGGARGLANSWQFLVHRARLEGFVVSDHADRFAAATGDLAGWLSDGRLIAREDVVDGTIDDFPATLLRLYRGANTGKLVLRIA